MGIKAANIQTPKTKVFDVAVSFVDPETNEKEEGTLTIEYFSDTLENSNERFKDYSKDEPIAKSLARRIKQLKGDGDDEWLEPTEEYFASMRGEVSGQILKRLQEELQPFARLQKELKPDD